MNTSKSNNKSKFSYDKKWRKSKSDNFALQKVPFCRNDPFIINDNQLNDKNFYEKAVALTNKSVKLYKDNYKIDWNQYVNQYSNSSEECLNINITGIDSLRIDHYKHNETPEIELKILLKQANTTYKNTMRTLFEPYIYGIESILDIILSFKGLHSFPIRYSVEMLPFLHPTVRHYGNRQSLFNIAVKNKTQKGALNTCVINYIVPDHISCNIIEDIYDEFVNHIRKKFTLRGNFNEQAVFYIPSKNVFMNIESRSMNNPAQINRNLVKNRFTRLYIESLSNFTMNSTQNAFWLDFVGIKYYYFERKRSYSPISWGSRSRCWNGDGLVLMSDGKTRKYIKDLCVGDKVSVSSILPNGIKTNHKSATVKVKIESIVNREYEMVGVRDKNASDGDDDDIMWISPYHAVIVNNNDDEMEWIMPCNIGIIEKKYVSSIYNFILDVGHTLNVNGIWGCTLGHDLKGKVIENPIWGSSYVMHDYFKNKNGFPNVVEYI